MKKTISINLNDELLTVDVEPNDTLLEVLRDKLGIKSTKVGCDRGDCGTCTVLLDGKSVRSCLVLAIEVDGQSVTTVEGLCREAPTELQKAFVEQNSFQCGFCEPGIVMSATELLRNNPSPNQKEVQEAIAGNLCRCTGYQSIIDAILSVSKNSKEGR
ncbi:(2Fe-2S)-binding protein [Candidatus Riflebacteria bacterium]